MDHSIPYSCVHASESDDDGLDEEVDEEGFTAKEAEAFTKVLGRDHWTPLFEDLSLADEGMAASQPNKATTKWVEDKDAVGEEHGLWDRAAKKLREEDAAKAERKKEEVREAKWKDDMKMDIQHSNCLRGIEDEHKKMMEKCQRNFVANWKKVSTENAARREWEHKRFTERVMKEAS
ncbi:hypothetical protein D1007_58765 [Hordeum vulgare]|nr:hypothetical protein D1007_58765 [Hordeum vulgare]